MADKSYRIPISQLQKEVLAKMLGTVPSKKVVQYDWTSEDGRAFIKAVRDLQFTGVPLPWIAEALDLTRGTLNGAISYWERPAKSRRGPKRQRIPLRKPHKDDPAVNDDDDRLGGA